MAALLQTRGRGWIQESYETGDPSLKTRAKALRSKGYRVTSSSMGQQITQYGRIKMTLLDIRPGSSGDEYLEQINPARKQKNAFKWQVRKRVRKALKKYVRGNAGWRKTGLGKRSIRAFKKRSLKEGHSRADILRTVKAHMKRKNPPRVKGRKVKGGRAVTLRNFTGTIVRKSDGRVEILGKGRRK